LTTFVSLIDFDLGYSMEKQELFAVDDFIRWKRQALEVEQVMTLLEHIEKGIIGPFKVTEVRNVTGEDARGVGHSQLLKVLNCKDFTRDNVIEIPGLLSGFWFEKVPRLN